MVEFRGLDWIYDVTTDTNTIAARARAFEQHIASTLISQPRNDPDARVPLALLQERRRRHGGRIEALSRDLRRCKPERREPSAA